MWERASGLAIIVFRIWGNCFSDKIIEVIYVPSSFKFKWAALKLSKEIGLIESRMSGVVKTGAVKTRKPRQPRASASASASAKQEQEQEQQQEVPVAVEVKKRAKKEKKPIQVVAIVTSDGIEGSFTPEPRRPLIVHFPFNSNEVEFNEALQYDPKPPPQVQPYDGDQNYFQVNSEKCSDENQIGVELDGWKMSLEEQLKKQPSASFGDASSCKVSGKTFEALGIVSAPAPAPAPAPVATADKSILPTNNYLHVVPEKRQLLTCYSIKTGETFVPPSSTEVQCFWCTHSFEGSPCFLPVKEESKVYHVYGNYCTPQCGLAYLLYEHLDSHVRWERMSLLHRMYKSVGRLYPAPPRECLKAYGGIYTIDEFRKIIGENRIRVDVQVPPMVSILGTLDTKPIDFYDSSLQNTFTQGFSMDRFKAWSEQGGALRLKRSKPLKDHESTLDACIQISVKRG